MPQGIQVYDAAGGLLFDTSYHMGFILGSVVIGAGNQSGNLVDANLLLGDPFFVMFNTLTDRFDRPNVLFLGNTMVWSATSGLYTGRLFYGVI